MYHNVCHIASYVRIVLTVQVIRAAKLQGVVEILISRNEFATLYTGTYLIAYMPAEDAHLLMLTRSHWER